MDQVLVVKLGGGAGLDLAAACADLAQIARARPLVIVHGVSSIMARLCAERGVAEEMLVSPSGHRSRYTPAPVRDLFVEAARLMHDEILEHLRRGGVTPAPMFDAGVIEGERKAAVRAVVNGRVRIVRDDYTGGITRIHAEMLRAALRAGAVPVVPPLAISPDGALNIDGDRAGAAVAGALGAETLVILSNVEGLYSHAETVVRQVGAAQMAHAMDWAQGRMKHKVLGAQEALGQGVGRVVIADGRVAQPITLALNGAGTVFTS